MQNALTYSSRPSRKSPNGSSLPWSWCLLDCNFLCIKFQLSISLVWQIVNLQKHLTLFCSTSLPQASSRWVRLTFYKLLSTVCIAVNKSQQHQEKNSWECWETVPGLLGEKQVGYLFALKPLPLHLTLWRSFTAESNFSCVTLSVANKKVTKNNCKSHCLPGTHSGRGVFLCPPSLPVLGKVQEGLTVWMIVVVALL